MVSKSLWQLSLAGVALVLNLVSPVQSADYVSETSSAIQAFDRFFYNQSTGLWDNAWWNSGNGLHIISIFARLRPNEATQLNLNGIIRNTYVKAQQTVVTTQKTIDSVGMMRSVSYFSLNTPSRRSSRLDTRGFKNFLNDYYDDELWWAGALIAAYDATNNVDYLNSAVGIFNDVQTTASGTPCNGGIYWDRKRTYVNAIANELYLYVTARLASRVSRDTYLPIAQKQWAWFNSTGMINGQNLVNDGLDANCQNNHLTTWSYNQGVVLGGLTELWKLTRDASYLSTAVAIANAAIDALSQNGILVEADQCELRDGNCGMDGQQFKGVFLRHLAFLNDVVHSSKFSAFIRANADSIWNNDRNPDNLLGVSWLGPYINTTGPADSSAIDALVAAVGLSR